MSSSDRGGLPAVLAVFGVPRSGTSWVGQLLNSSPVVAYRYQPLFSYEFKDRLSERSSREDIESFHIDLLGASSTFVLQRTTVAGGPAPSFSKADPELLVWKEVRHLHLAGHLLSNSDIKTILVVRHPGAVINSWFLAPKEFDAAWDPMSEWRRARLKNEGRAENFYGYDRWKAATRMFLELRRCHPGRVLLLRYEDLVAEPLKATRRMFDHAGIPLEAPTREFLAASTSRDDGDPYGVFRYGPDSGRWRDQLDARIAGELLRDLGQSGLGTELGYH